LRAFASDFHNPILYVQRNLLYLLPVPHYGEHIVDGWTMHRVGGEHMPDEIVELVTVSILGVRWNFK